MWVKHWRMLQRSFNCPDESLLRGIAQKMRRIVRPVGYPYPN
jgi:hypothetical protein